MTDRRAARAHISAEGHARYAGNELPAHLASGPCIEDWADPAYVGRPCHSARRRWNAAVDEWAVSSGWARDGRPALNARNLARSRHAWSWEFLLADGRADLVAWLEGRGPNPAEQPPPHEWIRGRPHQTA